MGGTSTPTRSPTTGDPMSSSCGMWAALSSISQRTARWWMITMPALPPTALLCRGGECPTIADDGFGVGDRKLPLGARWDWVRGSWGGGVGRGLTDFV